jgi:murein DD-endopeptidase MepM/ murein hydrolase activator NlpD
LQTCPRSLSIAFALATFAAASIWNAGAEAKVAHSIAMLRSAAPVGVEAVAARAQATIAKAEVAAARPQWVFEGRDVDGDGAPDFVNPTGMAPREHDAFGAGEFGASRDGGVRRHEGVDYIARAGQAVAAPISGYVTKIGYAYEDAPELRFVEITNPALKYVARVFYVDPAVKVGQPVALGDPIGAVETLQHRYRGITDHVHLEIAAKGRRIDAETVIVAQLKTPATRG